MRDMTRTATDIDWSLVNNDIWGIFIAVLGCGLVVVAVGVFLFAFSFAGRLAWKLIKDGEL